jgi:hypothetical protein
VPGRARADRLGDLHGQVRRSESGDRLRDDLRGELVRRRLRVADGLHDATGGYRAVFVSALAALAAAATPMWVVRELREFR